MSSRKKFYPVGHGTRQSSHRICVVSINETCNNIGSGRINCEYIHGQEV